MTKLRSYFLWFFGLCIVLTLIVGVVAALLPASVGGILTAVPYLGAMIFVLFKFLKKERRAPTVQEKKKFTLGFSLIFGAITCVVFYLACFYLPEKTLRFCRTLCFTSNNLSS